MGGVSAPGFVRRSEPIKWTVNAMVDKWTPSQVDNLRRELGREPTSLELAGAYTPDHVEHPDNMLTTAGLTLIMNRLVGTGSTMAVDNTHTRIGVGNGTSPELVGQTNLTGATTYFMTMDATYPTVNAGVLTARSTFGANDANFVWAEWGIDVNTAAAAAPGATVANVLLNRKVAALGTKASGAVWQLTVTLTLA